MGGKHYRIIFTSFTRDTESLKKNFFKGFVFSLDPFHSCFPLEIVSFLYYVGCTLFLKKHELNNVNEEVEREVPVSKFWKEIRYRHDSCLWRAKSDSRAFSKLVSFSPLFLLCNEGEN